MPDWERQYDHLEALWKALCEHHPIVEQTSRVKHLRFGELPTGAAKFTRAKLGDAAASGRMQPFTFGLRSQVAGDEILIACESTIGTADLEDDAVINALMEALDGTGAVKLCVDPRVGKHQDRIYVRRELLFDPNATQVPRISSRCSRTLFSPPSACTPCSKTLACSARGLTDGRAASLDRPRRSPTSAFRGDATEGGYESRSRETGARRLCASLGEEIATSSLQSSPRSAR